MILAALILFGLGATAAVVAFWDDLREWVLDVARGWVRKHLGSWAESLLVEAVVKLDVLVSRIKRFVRRTIYAKTRDRSRARVVVEDVPFEDLPDEIQEELEDEGTLEHTYDAG